MAPTSARALSSFQLEEVVYAFVAAVFASTLEAVVQVKGASLAALTAIITPSQEVALGAATGTRVVTGDTAFVEALAVVADAVEERLARAAFEARFGVAFKAELSVEFVTWKASAELGPIQVKSAEVVAFGALVA